MNGLMKKFENDLYNLINNSNLQIGEAYYILKCSLLELEKLYEDCVQDDLSGKTQKIITENIDVPHPEGQNLDFSIKTDSNDESNVKIIKES